jgi:hypothetical protein
VELPIALEFGRNSTISLHGPPPQKFPRNKG